METKSSSVLHICISLHVNNQFCPSVSVIVSSMKKKSAHLQLLYVCGNNMAIN